jgi:glucose-1-phosphate thymidylyltransferase
MIKNGDIFVPKEIDIWMDCGTPELLINSTKIIMDTYHDNAEEKRVFDKEVIIKPPVFIGKNVKIQNSSIGPYVSIGDNSKIENTKINNSIIFNSVEINNSDIDNSIIGSNTKFEGSGSEIFLGDNSKSINNEV